MSAAAHDDALIYVEICLQKDRTNSEAHDIKGLILQQQGKLDEALISFNTALSCNARNADALLHKAALLKDAGFVTALANLLPQIQRLPAQPACANPLPMRDKSKAMDAHQPREIQQPNQEYEAGNQKFIAKLADLSREVNELRLRVTVVERRMDTLESRMGIIEEKIYTLEHSMAILHRVVGDINERAKQATHDSELVDLLLERRKINEREQQIKRFNKHPDLADFYHALLSEMSATYIAALVIASQKVGMQASNTYSRAAGAVDAVLALLPVIGTLASRLTQGVALVIDTRQNAVDRNKQLRIKDVTSTTEEFDNIALRVAVQLTLAHEKRILALNRAAVPNDWKTRMAGLLADGLDGLITSFIADNSTVAKLWGRAEAQAIITHLQEPRIAENYRFEEEQGEHGSPSRKRRLFDISGLVFKTHAPNYLKARLMATQ